jgi:TorA maturation chaperone TorD
MSPEEKGFFCQLMASLFSPPDREIIEEVVEGRLPSFFKKYVETWGGDESLLKGLILNGNPEKVFEDVRSEYDRLFGEGGSEKISLVESYYKPWTHDILCPLPFAKEKGYLMGDSALHLQTLYRHCSLEIPDLFKGMPDHLVLELEFLSFLYQCTGDQEIRKVIEDHLDWIPLLKEECKKAQAHPFYLTLTDMLQLFINSEKERLENESHGEKEIHSEVL